MYSMLLVDDEDYVIEGMKIAIPWKKYGIEIVGCVHSGRQALDFLSKRPVDILVTDIMMPEMNGIELIERIDALRINIKLVVLSAYSDFEYAKKAIRYHVFDYLLKPVMLENLREVFRRLSRSLDEERQSSERQARLSSSLPRLTERYYFERIHGHAAPMPDALRGRAAPHSYVVAILRADAPERGPMVGALRDFLEGLPENAGHTAVCVNASDVALVMPMSIGAGEGGLPALLRGLQRTVEAHFGATLSIGVGTRLRHEGGIHKSYQEASRALEKRVLFGPNALIFYAPPVQGERIDPRWLSRQRQSLERSVELRDAQSMGDTLSEIRRGLSRCSDCEVEDLERVYTELVLILQKATKVLDDPTQGFAEYCAHLLHQLHRAEGLKDLFDKLQAGFDLLIRELDSNHSPSPKNQRAIRQITQYVHDNLNTNLSLSKLSAVIGLTPNYLGLIFRQSMGISFNEYVAQARMCEAKQLLAGNYYKVYEVAAMVGYKNTNYFSKLFTEHTGKSPSEYRA